jgi:uncharacterized delta-60 repeat protein
MKRVVFDNLLVNLFMVYGRTQINMKKILNIILTLILCSRSVFSQPGSLDNSFNPGTGFNASVKTTSIQADGKIIVGGFFSIYNGTSSRSIIRLNENGDIDSTFNSGLGFNNIVEATSIQADGKIIVGGNFTAYNGTTINRIARLNVNGSLDSTFNPPGTGFNMTVITTCIQEDGKIIVGGNFTSFNGTSINRIARLNVDGSLDSSFFIGTGFNHNIRTTCIQSDGKIIVGGNFSLYSGTSTNRIARLNVDGSLDTTFNTGIGFSDFIETSCIQADGKIIVGGNFNIFNGTVINRIARLNLDGSLDATFNPGTGFNSFVGAIRLQADGKIIVGGGFTNLNGFSRNKIARLNVNGSIDFVFNPETGFDNSIYTISIQADEKIIAGGYFSSFNGSNRSRIARILNCWEVDAPSNVNICESYTLPSLIAGDYFTAANGGGTMLNEGDLISNTQTIFVYATYGICSDENSFTVTINTPPSNSISLSNNTLTADYLGANYQWLDCDTNFIPIPDANQISFSPTQSGNYAVLITQNGCETTSDCYFVESNSIGFQNDNTSQIKFKLYPNPNNGFFTIESNLVGEFYIVNSLGELISSFSLDNYGKAELKLNDLSSGFYYIINKFFATPVKLIIQ